jgi:diguanylate cyclase (GGDEF)-like protein/PAS domain S-box-containing protein
VAVGSNLVVALASLALAPVLGVTPSALWIGAVAISTWAGGLRPGLLATGLGALLFALFIAPSVIALALDSPLLALALGAFVLVEGVVVALTALLRQEVARQRQARDALERAYGQLRATEAERGRLAAIIEATPDLVAIADASGHRLYLNPAGRKLLGIGQNDDLTRGRLGGDRPEWARAQFVKEILPTATREGSWTGESAYRTADGRDIPVLKVVLAHRAEDGTVAFYSTIARDISRRKQLEAQLEQQARVLAAANATLKEQAGTDTLTGLANREHSLELLEMVLALARRQGRPVCFAFLDLDHFKQVNDRYGHQMGDAVLRRVGQLLRSAFRGEDVVARWGGEEFFVGLFGTIKADAVKRLGTVLDQLRAETFTAPDGTRFRVTCSAGIAQFPTDATEVQTLYALADRALYQAKAAGRDRIVPVGG